jgi:hypothetical protein
VSVGWTCRRPQLVTQELGILALIKRCIRMFTANGDDLTDSSDPSRKMMRQIAGSFAEYEKARLARERKRLTRASAKVARAMVRPGNHPKRTSYLLFERHQ